MAMSHARQHGESASTYIDRIKGVWPELARKYLANIHDAGFIASVNPKNISEAIIVNPRYVFRSKRGLSRVVNMPIAIAEELGAIYDRIESRKLIDAEIWLQDNARTRWPPSIISQMDSLDAHEFMDQERDKYRGPYVSPPFKDREQAVYFACSTLKMPTKGDESDLTYLHQYAQDIIERLNPATSYEFYHRGMKYFPNGGIEWADEYTRAFFRGSSSDPVLVMHGRDITPGLLSYIIDKEYRFYAEEYDGDVEGEVSYVGALVPLVEHRDWQPMRDGEINCVAAALLDATYGKKQRGRHRSPKEIIDEWERTVRETGAGFEDVYKIEKQLEIKIVFVDVRGVILSQSTWNPAGKVKIVKLCRFNGHCVIYDKLPEFPKEGDRVIERAFPMNKNEYLGAPSRKAAKKCPELREKYKKFVAEERTKLMKIASSAPPGIRSWLVGRELVYSDGRVFRSSVYEDEILRKVGMDGEEYETCDILWDEKMKYLRHIGGFQAHMFRSWSEENKLKKIQLQHIPAWKSAMVEFKLWQSADKYDVKDYVELDMRAAFLACEDPDYLCYGRTTGPAIEYVRAYKMPSGEECRRWSPISNLSQAEGYGGSIVRFSSWKFQGPPFIGLYESHLEENQGLMPTPLAICLRDLGYLVEHKLREIAYDVPSQPLTFSRWQRSEEDKQMAINFVGSCIQRPTKSLITTDKEEAIYFYNLLLRNGCATTMSDNAPYVVTYTDRDEGVRYPHIRSYVLAYSHINLLYKLRDHENAVRICCDSIAIPRGSSPSGPDPDERFMRAGYWRVKSDPKPWISTVGSWNLRGDKMEIDAETGAVRRVNLLEKWLMNRLIYYSGQGGTAKSTHTIISLSGQNAVLVSKDWHGVHDLESKVEKAKREGHDMSRVRVHTWNGFFHAGLAPERCERGPECGKCLFCEGWKPERMGRARVGAGLPEFILWDEVGFVNIRYFEPIIKYLISRKVTVICAADLEGQLYNYAARSPVIKDCLEKLSAFEITSDIDYRSLCDDLRALKLRIWKKDERTQLSETANAIMKIGQYGSLDDLIKNWEPRDLFAVTRRKYAAKLNNILLEHHGLMFRDQPIPFRFAPQKESRHLFCDHDLTPVPGYLVGEEKMVPAYISTRVLVNYDEGMWYLRNDPKQYWIPDYARTCHALQGYTIDEEDGYWPKLFILGQGMCREWNRNSIYTAVSRVRYLHQLWWVTSV